MSPVRPSRRPQTEDDEAAADYEAEMLVLARAQLEVQQKIANYVGFFFWLAFIALTLAIGGAVAGAVAHWYG